MEICNCSQYIVKQQTAQKWTRDPCKASKNTSHWNKWGNKRNGNTFLWRQWVFSYHAWF